MNFESLCMLADFYSVTTDYLLGRTNVTNTPFDDEEINMIMNFRKLDERGKESVKATLSFEVAHSPHIQNTKKSAM